MNIFKLAQPLTSVSITNFASRFFIASCIIFICVSCGRLNEQGNDNPPALFPEPLTVPLNTDSGYRINQVTGDSIHPIINSLGDTLKTGIPIPVTGKIIDPLTLAEPTVTLAGKPTIVQANLNVHIIPENLTTIPVDETKLKKFIIGKDTSSFVLLDSEGDTILTGVPIPANGKTVPSILSQPVAALPLVNNSTSLYNMQNLEAYHGLKSSDIRCMMEDRSGYIWLATNNGGVSRYDGKYFTHFTKKEGLIRDIVVSILQDHRGNIWFDYGNGNISCYDSKNFTHFSFKRQNVGMSQNTILEDRMGNLWFSSLVGGVSRYDGKTFTHFTKKEGLNDNNVNSKLEDAHGNIWFATHAGVSRYDGKSFTYFTIKDGLINDNVHAIMEDRRGNIWFGTDSGVCRYNGKSFTHFTERNGLTNNLVLSMVEDKRGNLWLGTQKGVSRFDGKTFTQFTEKEGLINNNWVFAMLEDRQGNLWFGTQKGVSRYNVRNFIHYNEIAGFDNLKVNSIKEDYQGNLWFGTWGGLTKFKESQLSRFSKKEGLSNNYISTIMEDRQGNLWFGTVGGVTKFDGKRFINFTEKEGLSSNGINVILEDRKGTLWFGTQRGITRYDGKSFMQYTETEGMTNNNVISMYEDHQGNFWFGTHSGVTKFDGKRFIHFTEKEGLSNNSVKSILEDRLGNLWFGTHAGVCRFDGKSFICFTQREGLADEHVISMLKDSLGNLWISTWKGLTRLTTAFANELQTSKKINSRTTMSGIINYGEKNGLKSTLLDGYLDSKNRIWWGHSGEPGIIMLDLKPFDSSEKPLVTHLNDVTINGKFIDYSNPSKEDRNKIRFSAVEPFYNYPHNLKLPYDLNELTFYFNAIDWAAAAEVKYSYKMEGLGNNWSIPSSEAKANYQFLPPGTYTFKVKAISDSHEWGQSFEYSFTILPPWWKTTWFRILIGIALLFLLYGIYRWRTATLRKQKRVLEQTVTERTAEVVKQKEKSDELLLNILPSEVAEELKEKGYTTAKAFDEVTILFSDIKGFTNVSEKMTAHELVKEINAYFSAFDAIIQQYGLEKIKTIGDAYIAAGGLPEKNSATAQNVVEAAIVMQQEVEKLKHERISLDKPYFELRIGIHTGPVVAGVVGIKKFQYDMWGDTVNLAARMEQSGVPGKINISEHTYDIVKEQFTCVPRGKIKAKNKGEIDMYFVEERLQR
jgi:ligand-binding sensor domain-containing protein/class 3 adenylate cyclase